MLIALEEHYAWQPLSADNVMANWLRDHDRVDHSRLFDRARCDWNRWTHNRYLDDPAYLGLFDCAQRLEVPNYLHPTTQHPAVMDAWFKPYTKDGMHLLPGVSGPKPVPTRSAIFPPGFSTNSRWTVMFGPGSPA